MARSDTAAQIAAQIERILDNQYAQQSLREGIGHLREASARASKRRVKPARDERLRREVKAAVLSIVEAGKAFKSGRQKPKKRWGRRLLVLAGLGAVGAAIALAASDELRQSLFGQESDAPLPPAEPAGQRSEAEPAAEGAVA